jgi:hypothetical protein
MWTMKKILGVAAAFTLAGALLLSAGHAKAADSNQEIKVYLQGERIQFDTPPVIVDGTTMVQFRPVFEKLGLEITWDAKKKRIQGLRGKTVVVDLYLDNLNVTANGKTIKLDVAPTLMGDYTMVPLRFLGEASGKMVDWRASDKTVLITKGYEKDDSVTNPYGGDSFLVLDQLSKHSGIKPNLYQDKGGYLFVTWTKDVTTKNQIQGIETYASVARDGAWWSKNEQVSWRGKEVGNNPSFFLDGSYYIKSGTVLSKLVPSTSGNFTGVTLTLNLPSSKSQETMRPVLYNGSVAVLYKYSTETKTELRLYLDQGMDKYIIVKDVHKVLDNVRQNASLVYDSSRRVIYIIEDNSYRQLDVDTGDLKYGFDGKDLVIKLYEAKSGSTQRYLYNGTFYCFYLDEKSDTYNLVTVDKDLRASSPIITQIKQADLQNKTITFTDNSIRLWSIYDYNRKPSIQLLQFTR